jgi:hypothetical protein
LTIRKSAVSTLLVVAPSSDGANKRSVSDD